MALTFEQGVDGMNGRKALIYEDDQTTIGQLEAVLGGLGVDVVVGPDLAMIVETSRELQPDIIILSADVKHSFSACLKLKKDRDLKRVPLFMLAGRTPPDVISKHQRLPTRADVYLPTPLSPVMLTEILREQLPVLTVSSTPPERPVPPSVPSDADAVAEIPVSDNGDRTIVSTRAFEASVVNFVEDEVRDLKSTVVRLETEKGDLHGKISELESLLRNQSEVFDSGLKAIREQQASIERSSREISKIQDINGLIDEAVQQAVAATLKEATESAMRQREELETELARARGRIEEQTGFEQEASKLRKQVSKLEKALEDSKRRQEDQARQSVDTEALFARLESGYKESIAELEEERDALRERVSEAENEIEKLNARVKTFKYMSDQFPSLQEAAAKSEILAEEKARLAETVDLLQAQVASLELGLSSAESAGRRSEELADEVSRVRASENAVREELATLRTRFNQVRSLLGSGATPGEPSE